MQIQQEYAKTVDNDYDDDDDDNNEVENSNVTTIAKK